jgi:hypothetical protein
MRGTDLGGSDLDLLVDALTEMKQLCSIWVICTNELETRLGVKVYVCHLPTCRPVFAIWC